MTATFAPTAPRTVEDLHRAAFASVAPSNPNRTWHAQQFILRLVERAEREAYAIEDRRTIRARFTAAMTAIGSVVNDGHEVLIAAAESGEIEPCYLLAIVPDQYGRISPFAVSVQTETRSYTSRNYSLSGALAEARREQARGHRASVHFDTCG